MEPYLYHGIRNYDIERLINIIKTGYILPKKDLKDKYKVVRNEELDLNGQKWISLCQKSIYDESYAEISPSSFDSFIYKKYCIIFNNDIEGLTYTTHLIYDFYGAKYLKERAKDDSNTRVSTFSDEVQTSIKVPIKKSIALGYPKTYLESQQKDTKKELELIKEELLKHEYTIPIIDSSFYDFADDEEQIKKNTIIK